MIDKDKITLNEKAFATAKTNENVLNVTLGRRRESILVTGGAGFIGSSIAQALLARGKKVIVLDVFNQETSRSDEKESNVLTLKKAVKEYNEKSRSNFMKAEIFVLKGDIRDRSLLEEIIASPFYNITSVIHAAGMVDSRRSFSCANEYFDVNIKGTNTLLEILGKSNKIKRVLMASSACIFAETKDKRMKISESSIKQPISPYGVSKLAIEALAQCYSNLFQMQIFTIRIASCYGYKGRPDMLIRTLMENIDKGLPICIYGNGEATRTWLYIDDVVDCFIKALFYGRVDIEDNELTPVPFYSLSLCEEFNIGSSQGALSVQQVVDTVEEVLEKKATIIEVKNEPNREANFMGILDYSKATILLGWEPKYDLKQGLLTLKKYYDMENNKNDL